MRPPSATAKPHLLVSGSELRRKMEIEVALLGKNSSLTQRRHQSLWVSHHPGRNRARNTLSYAGFPDYIGVLSAIKGRSGDSGCGSFNGAGWSFWSRASLPSRPGMAAMANRYRLKKAMLCLSNCGPITGQFARKTVLLEIAGGSESSGRLAG